MKANIPYTTKQVSSVLQHPNLVYVANARQSVVYKHNSKIIKAISNFGITDPTYQYLRLCLNHQDNPFFPVIHNAKQYNSKELTEQELAYIAQFASEEDGKPPRARTNVLIVTTEYLTELAYNENITGYLMQLGIYDLVLAHRTHLVKNAHLGPAHLHTVEALDFAVYEAFQDATTRKKMLRSTTNRQFASALRLLEPLFTRLNYKPDMRFSGNILLRGQQIVINDPITYRRQIEVDAVKR